MFLSFDRVVISKSKDFCWRPPSLDIVGWRKSTLNDDERQSRWVVRNKQRIQVGGFILLIAAIIWEIHEGVTGIVMVISMLLIFSIIGPVKGDPYDKTKDLGSYISLTESMLYRSDTPVEEFQYLIYRFVTLDKLSQGQTDTILRHFAGRADNVGVEARRLLRDEEEEEIVSED